jgi:hypothetical protein
LIDKQRLEMSDSAGLPAASRRFPAHAVEIRQLTRNDEEFRGLCDDLAAAEEALGGVESLPEPVRTERRVECESWITSLAAEIEQALQHKNVIPLAGARRRP